MKRSLPLLVAFLLLASPCAFPGSIYAKRGHAPISLYADDTAHRIGDLITVVIKESAKIQNDEKREMDKDSSKKAGWGGSFGGQSFTPFALESSGTNAFDGNATFDSDRSVTDRITAIVLDVLPNGNLIIAGRRRRDTQGDTQYIRVSGIVRPSDISFANTVYSEQVADFQMIYEDAGQGQHFSNPGFGDRALNFIWPW